VDRRLAVSVGEKKAHAGVFSAACRELADRSTSVDQTERVRARQSRTNTLLTEDREAFGTLRPVNLVRAAPGEAGVH
jgi:hypothetical protein